MQMKKNKVLLLGGTVLFSVMGGIEKANSTETQQVLRNGSPRIVMPNRAMEEHTAHASKKATWKNRFISSCSKMNGFVGNFMGKVADSFTTSIFQEPVNYTQVYDSRGQAPGEGANDGEKGVGSTSMEGGASPVLGNSVLQKDKDASTSAGSHTTVRRKRLRTQKTANYEGDDRINGDSRMREEIKNEVLGMVRTDSSAVNSDKQEGDGGNEEEKKSEVVNAFEGEKKLDGGVIPTLKQTVITLPAASSNSA